MAAISLSFPFLSIIFLILLNSPPSLAATVKCIAEDKKALISIKTAFNNTSIFNNWTDNIACCDWTGIQCMASTNRVVSLRIIGSPDLSGYIPNAIADLPYLTSLIFSDLPGLIGPIPPSLARLPNLSTLILSNNSLSGQIPSFLSHINSLQLLDLSYNHFSGSIPPELSLLRKLSLLRLSHNLLSGRIPATLGNFNKSSPPQLDLSNNHLFGRLPTEMGHPHWGFIDLSNNFLSGDASGLFGAEKTKTTRINLSSNRFQFDMSKITFPINLGVLYLNHNDINGSIPSQINQLTHLIVLNLSYNQLCEEIPDGPVTSKFGKEAYVGNKCLCGAPLGPCPESG